MYITQHLTLLSLTVGNFLGLLIFLYALIKSPWKQLAAKSIRQHLWLGCILFLSVFWSALNIRVTPEITFHIMLTTTLYFLFGCRLSLVNAGIALAFSQAIADIPFANWGLNYLISVVAPILTAGLVLWVINRIHYQNLFVFMLGGGFFGSILAIITTAAAATAFTWLLEPDIYLELQNHIATFFVMSFPEGFCNGALISTATVLNPSLLKTYDDEFYLQRKPPN